MDLSCLLLTSCAEISTPCEINFVRFSSYDGMCSTGSVKELLGLNQSLKGRTVVVVEDIIDSGLTMQELLVYLQKFEPAELKVASLLVKPGNMQVKLDIDYTCFEIPNDFIVGYGLDYDGFGRNLSSIYTVVEDYSSESLCNPHSGTYIRCWS